MMAAEPEAILSYYRHVEFPVPALMAVRRVQDYTNLWFGDAILYFRCRSISALVDVREIG
jgi:hypothetical protein